jgi:fructokinase
MNQFATRAGIVRLSDSDFAFLYGGHEYAKRAEALFAADTKLFIVTRGVRGAQAWHERAGVIDVETPQVEVVDTIGAGDSFRQDFWSLCAPGPDHGEAARRDDRGRTPSRGRPCNQVRGFHLRSARRRSSLSL